MISFLAWGDAVGAEEDDVAGLARIGNCYCDAECHSVVLDVEGFNVRVSGKHCGSDVLGLGLVLVSGLRCDEIEVQVLHNAGLETLAAVQGV